jgi:hypothetical protein
MFGREGDGSVEFGEVKDTRFRAWRESADLEKDKFDEMEVI